MAIATLHTSSDFKWAYHRGTADANSDVSEVFYHPLPMRGFAVQGTRPTSGNFSFTLQASLDGVNFETIATCTVAGGTQDYQAVADVPARFVRVVFTDVGGSTITWNVVGVV